MRKNSAIFFFVFFANVLYAINPVDNFINNSLLRNANISLLVRDLKTGKTVSEYRASNAAIPASTMKVITTATALELLGPDFRFETVLELDGKLSADSVFNGNLYIRGGGDPTLGSEKLGDKYFLKKWVAEIKKAGIKHIIGQIVADESLYDNEGVNPLWTWEDIGNYYAPAIYGISYLDNTCRVVFRSGKVGSTPAIIKTIPDIPELVFDNHLKSSRISYDSGYFYGAPHSYHRSIRGEIPANKNEFTVKSDIPEPGLQLVKDLQHELIANGVSFKSTIDKQMVSGKRKVIFKHYSPTLSEIIAETNYKSNNFFAESIFRYLGTKYTAEGSIKGSIRVIRDYWQSKGLPVSQYNQYDGCGLSPSNVVSANFFVDLLTYMNTKSKYKDAFFNSLPVSGVSGTLSHFLNGTSLQGKVHAKSGTITNVKCYAGYIDGKNTTYVFALLVNDANGSSSAVVKKMEDFLLSVE